MVLLMGSWRTRVPVRARDRVRQRGSDRRDADLADAGRRLGRLDQVDLDPRHRAHPHDRIGSKFWVTMSPPSPRTTSPHAAALRPQSSPPSTCARIRSGLTFRPAVEREHDPVDMDAPARVERDLRDLGAVAEKAGARDPARPPFGQR